MISRQYKKTNTMQRKQAFSETLVLGCVHTGVPLEVGAMLCARDTAGGIYNFFEFIYLVL